MSGEQRQNRNTTEFTQENNEKFILDQETLEALIARQTPIKIKRSDGSIVEGTVESAQRLAPGEFDLDNVSIVVKFFDSEKDKIGRKNVDGRQFLEWQEDGAGREPALENSGVIVNTLKPGEKQGIFYSDTQEKRKASIELLKGSLNDLENKKRDDEVKMERELGLDYHGNPQSVWSKYKRSDYLKERSNSRPGIVVSGFYGYKIRIQIRQNNLYIDPNQSLIKSEVTLLDSAIEEVRSFLSEARTRFDKESKLLPELKKGDSQNFLAKFWWRRFGDGKKIANQLPPKENKTPERGYYRGEDFIVLQPTFWEGVSDKVSRYLGDAADFVFPGDEISDALRKTEEKFFVEKSLVISAEHDLASLELVKDWATKNG